MPFKREDMTFDFSTGTLSLKLPMEIQPFKRFRLRNPAAVIFVDIYKWLPLTSTVENLFSGKVVGVSTDVDNHESTLSLVSWQSIMQGKIPSRTYSRACNFNLGDTQCGVTLANFSVSCTFADLTVSGSSITATVLGTKADGYFINGWLTISDQKIMIVDHTTTTIKTLYNLDPDLLIATDAITFYAGCNKSVSMCLSTFSNSVNFGGFPCVPSTNIFIDGWK